jgi:hypothetical protein
MSGGRPKLRQIHPPRVRPDLLDRLNDISLFKSKDDCGWYGAWSWPDVGASCICAAHFTYFDRPIWALGDNIIWWMCHNIIRRLGGISHVTPRSHAALATPHRSCSYLPQNCRNLRSHRYGDWVKFCIWDSWIGLGSGVDWCSRKAVVLADRWKGIARALFGNGMVVRAFDMAHVAEVTGSRYGIDRCGRVNLFSGNNRLCAFWHAISKCNLAWDRAGGIDMLFRRNCTEYLTYYGSSSAQCAPAILHIVTTHQGILSHKIAHGETGLRPDVCPHTTASRR